MTSVVLHIYDMSRGMARSLSQAFLGKQIDGVWHTGIVVYGQEYFFGGGISCMPPVEFAQQYGMEPTERLTLGMTSFSKAEFETFLRSQLGHTFTQESYNLFSHNCNNFSDECARFLVGTGIPEHIKSLPQEFLDTPLGQMVRPLIENLQHQILSPTHRIGDGNLSSASASQEQRLNNAIGQMANNANRALNGAIDGTAGLNNSALLGSVGGGVGGGLNNTNLVSGIGSTTGGGLNNSNLLAALGGLTAGLNNVAANGVNNSAVMDALGGLNNSNLLGRGTTPNALTNVLNNAQGFARQIALDPPALSNAPLLASDPKLATFAWNSIKGPLASQVGTEEMDELATLSTVLASSSPSSSPLPQLGVFSLCGVVEAAMNDAPDSADAGSGVPSRTWILCLARGLVLHSDGNEAFAGSGALEAVLHRVARLVPLFTQPSSSAPSSPLVSEMSMALAVLANAVSQDKSRALLLNCSSSQSAKLVDVAISLLGCKSNPNVRQMAAAILVNVALKLPPCDSEVGDVPVQIMCSIMDGVAGELDEETRWRCLYAVAHIFTNQRAAVQLAEDLGFVDTLRQLIVPNNNGKVQQILRSILRLCP